MVQAPALLPPPAPELPPLGSSSPSLLLPSLLLPSLLLPSLLLPSLLLPSLWPCPGVCLLSLQPRQLLSLWDRGCDVPPGQAGAS